MSHTCDCIGRTGIKDLHSVKPNRTAGFKRAVRTLDGDTNCVQVSNLRSELSLGILWVDQSNGTTNSETSLTLSVTDIAVDRTGAVSILSKWNSQLILLTMYNNGAIAIIKEMCDIKAFRFRHSLRFGVSEEHLTISNENIVLSSVGSHTNYTYRHVTRQQFSRFNCTDVIPLEAAKNAVFIFLWSVIPMRRMRTNFWGGTMILCDHVNNQELDACDIRRLWAG
jgi:hypothetical protein